MLGNGTRLEIGKSEGQQQIEKLEMRTMRITKKVVASLVILSVITLATLPASAGVIVNLKDRDTTQQCVESKTVYRTTLSKGVIVNFTGVIVNFTGVIVNLTGVIVNLSDGNSECGFIPTSDRGKF